MGGGEGMKIIVEGDLDISLGKWEGDGLDLCSVYIGKGAWVDLAEHWADQLGLEGRKLKGPRVRITLEVLGETKIIHCPSCGNAGVNERRRVKVDYGCLKCGCCFTLSEV